MVAAADRASSRAEGANALPAGAFHNRGALAAGCHARGKTFREAVFLGGRLKSLTHRWKPFTPAKEPVGTATLLRQLGPAVILEEALSEK